VAAGKVRGHRQILVIRQTYRLTRLGLERARITNDLQSMLDTLARQGGLSDYAHVAAPRPATGTPPGGGDPRTPGTLCRAGSGARIADYHAIWPSH
jgi:hypothetical protein